MKKLSLLFFLLISIFEITIAQTITVTGSVKNEKGIALPFAFVQDKQIQSAVYADSLGNFSIRANSNSALQFSLKGYSDTLIKIENNTDLQVTLRYNGSTQNKSTDGLKTTNTDVTVSDAFSGTTNMNSTYNTSSSEAGGGGESIFNNGSFPVVKEKEYTHGSRYLFADWADGSVINAKGLLVKNPAFLFNYDKIQGDLLLTHDKKNAIIIDKDKIQSFILYNQTKEPYIFEKVPAIDNIHFIQVLSSGSKYKIYKLTKTKFIKSDYSTNGLVTTGNSYDEYVDENTYYVLNVQSNLLQKLILKKKSIKEIFENEGNKLNNFFKEHSTSSIDDHFLKNLGDYFNN